MMASAMQENIQELNLKVQQQTLQRSDLKAFLSEAEQATTLIMRGLTSAASLVSSFKQVAVDRATAHRRMFDLQQMLHEVVATMMRKIRPVGHEIEIDVAAEIEVNSYPGPLGQVISSLISNALIHGFEGREQGHMRLSAHQVEVGRVQIHFEDDGVGIAEQNISRIFDPFFTTKEQGTGLGLAIVKKIVDMHGGSIEVTSLKGEYTEFILKLRMED
jgi:signal transduction histidine kinase